MLPPVARRRPHLLVRTLAAGAGKTYTSAMSVMAQRGAKQAVAYMFQYFASQNWIPQSMVQTADTRLSSY